MASYEDKFCSIDTEGVVKIKWFYFPLGLTKTIRREKIQDIEMVDSKGLLDSKWWGMAMNNIWWACGFKGCSGPKKLIVITTSGTFRKGFACENGQAFMDAYNHRDHNQQTPLVAGDAPASSDKKEQ